MTRFEVFVYGKVPDCLEVEADTNDAAVEAAIQQILENIDLQAAPCEGEKCCSKDTGEAPPPGAKKRRSAGSG